METYIETDYPEEFPDPWVARLVGPVLFACKDTASLRASRELLLVHVSRKGRNKVQPHVCQVATR